MNATQFDEITRRLEEAGQDAPEGRLHHVCYGEGDRLQVMDVWESEQAFGQFAQYLLPIIQQVGIEVDQPAMAPVHYMKVGQPSLQPA
jgi:hypothetical protein